MRTFGALTLAVTLVGSMAYAQGTGQEQKQGKPKSGWTKRILEFEKSREKAPEERAAKREARSSQWIKFGGDKLAPRVEKLLAELTWHRDLAVAQQESKRTGKPILWVHALGEVDGFL